jgi:hypothetical protein
MCAPRASEAITCRWPVGKGSTRSAFWGRERSADTPERATTRVPESHTLAPFAGTGEGARIEGRSNLEANPADPRPASGFRQRPNRVAALR